jgi:hypothetical protein
MSNVEEVFTMGEITKPAHAETLQSPANDSGQVWREAAAGAWSDQKKVWGDWLTGQSNMKEAGIAISEEGLGLLAISPLFEPAAIAGAIAEVGGLTLMAIGNRLGE